jgi:lysophospholipase L1-like esterase
VLACVALAAATLSACSAAGSVGAAAVPSVSPSGPAETYVAIGASETLGFGAQDPVRQAWTQVFYRTALPRATTFVNLGIPGATVEEALQREVPEAESLHPNVVTVWLNVNDILAGVEPSDYEREITSLLAEVRAHGHPTILVANTPPLDRLPRFVGCEPFAPGPDGCDTTRRLSAAALDGLVDEYNAAIAHAASIEGATVVDLHAVGLAARRSGREAELVSADGLHPSTAGHLAIGLAFARALRQAGAG